MLSFTSRISVVFNSVFFSVLFWVKSKQDKKELILFFSYRQTEKEIHFQTALIQTSGKGWNYVKPKTFLCLLRILLLNKYCNWIRKYIFTFTSKLAKDIRCFNTREAHKISLFFKLKNCNREPSFIFLSAWKHIFDGTDVKLYDFDGVHTLLLFSFISLFKKKRHCDYSHLTISA